ncbi:MAG TPA: DUF4440 domain-containing protein [Polyangiaceae bacterium]|nr:DUF4440 domain-containing protein [Polyangiaceae bacterium]
MLTDEIRDGERQLLTATVRASAEALERLVSDEFVEFGSSGRVYGKAEVIAQMLAMPNVSVTITDFAVLALSPDVALATYKTPGSLRSSIWRREGAGWRIVFHQGTPVAAGG